MMVVKEFQHKILHIEGGQSLCYKRGKFWLEDGKENTPLTIKTPLLSKNRLFERMMRLEPRLAFCLNSVFYFSYRGHLYRVDKDNKTAVMVCSFRDGMNNPLSVCHASVDGKEYMYWGDYWPNSKKENANIFRFDGSVLEKVLTISDVKHIHSVVFDKWRNCFYILTGDSNEESNILIANTSFTKVEKMFGRSDLKFRTCALMVLEDSLIYATDMPNNPNLLYKCKIKNGTFLEPEPLCDLPGPTIFAYLASDKLFFSTSVESNPNQNKFKYLLSKKIGKGNIDYNSYLLSFDCKNGLTNIIQLKKDKHSMSLFGFGNIQIISIDRNGIYCYCSALEKSDGKTIVLNCEVQDACH